jgi:hypothetical protein
LIFTLGSQLKITILCIVVVKLLLKPHLFQVQNDLGHVFVNPLDGAELMVNSLYAQARDREPLQ